MNSENLNEIDFTRGVVSQSDLLSIATNGMVFSFEVKKDGENRPYLVAYFGTNSIQYRVPRTTALVKAPLHGTLEENIAFVNLFTARVAASWDGAINQDKQKVISALTE